MPALKYDTAIRRVWAHYATTPRQPNQPDDEVLAEWLTRHRANAIDGCDDIPWKGVCEHGEPSWLIHLGLTK